MSEQFLTVKQVAELLGVSSFFVYKEKAIPRVYLSSRTIRFRREAVEQWFKDREKIQ